MLRVELWIMIADHANTPIRSIRSGAARLDPVERRATEGDGVHFVLVCCAVSGLILTSTPLNVA